MSASRAIWLCADDYGMTPGINTAIRDLIARGRLNATSAMVAAPAGGVDEAAALSALNAPDKRAAIGLHVTMTAPFRPLCESFAPLDADGRFLPLARMLALSMARRLNRRLLADEVAAQLRTFGDLFGRPPDFVDGHQHVHLFPQVRDAVLAAVAGHAPQAWVRQCGARGPWRGRWRDRKGVLIGLLSRQFRARAARHGLRTNTAFAGTYNFRETADYARIFPGFLRNLPDDGLVMCHPGIVDDLLPRLDTLTSLREREYAYLRGDAFAAALAAGKVTLARPAEALSHSPPTRLYAGRIGPETKDMQP